MVNARRCRVVGWFPYFWLGGVLLVTSLATIFLVAVLATGERDAPPLLFSAAVLAVMVWNCYVGLVMIAYEIQLDQSGHLEFRSILRRRRMHTADLVSITANWADPYTLVFRSRTSATRTVRMMDGMHDLIQEVRSINPDVELRGL